MEPHPNVARIQAFLDAYTNDDTEAMASLLADDIVWHVAGKHRFSGTYRGRGDVLAYFARVGEETKGSLKLDPMEVLANDTRGAVFLRVTGDRDGSRLDVVMAEAFTFDGDGRLAEYWATANDQAAIDAFWG